MKTIIYYYTLTGHCEQLAEKFASKLNCEAEKIIEKKRRLFTKGFLRFFNGGEAIQKKSSRIQELKSNPLDYDRVVIITPFWAASPTPAVRGFAKQYYDQLKGKKLGLIITNLGSEPDEAFEKYEEIFPEPLVKQSFTKAKKEWLDPIESELIAEFIKEINI